MFFINCQGCVSGKPEWLMDVTETQKLYQIMGSLFKGGYNKSESRANVEIIDWRAAAALKPPKVKRQCGLTADFKTNILYIVLCCLSNFHICLQGNFIQI